jgi:hypothetical protein
MLFLNHASRKTAQKRPLSREDRMASTQKMVMVVYNEAMESEVMEALQKCSLKNYTKIPGVYGKGGSSGTHLGDDIWPGRNNVMYIACPEKEARNLSAEVKRLRGVLGHEGIKSFQWSLEEGD